MSQHHIRRTGLARRLPHTPRGPRRAAVLATVAVLSLLVTGTVATQTSAPAFAVDYPTWSDVQNAKASETAKQAEVDRIRTLLSQLAADVAATKTLATQKGAEYETAQSAFDIADFRASELQSQADVSRATAEKSKMRAGQLAAKLARSGGDDVSVSLFFDSTSASDLLGQLGMANKIGDLSAGIYTKALQDQNTAQGLTDQANRAKDALKALSEAAAVALAAANAAADAANVALTAQQDNEAQLQAQLAVLTEDRVATEADYNAGVAARAAAAAARAKVLADALAAARADAAAAAAASAAAGNTGTSAPAGVVGSQNWALPASGHISSPYGNRINPVSGIYSFHGGVDIGAGCGRPIYAAHSGTVVVAGPYGGYGNYVRIDDGDGVSTAYGHIVDGGVLVARGQIVSAGQVIARVGSTGNSTGCHLHFEVRLDGSTTDPVSYLRSRGITIG